MTGGRPLHALVLVALALGPGCGEVGAVADRPVGEAGRSPAVDGSLEGLWWTELGSQSVAVFHLGPVLSTPRGALRRWTLAVHLPGTPEMLSLAPGLVDVDDLLPVGLAGELFSVELRPATGHTWGSVLSRDDLVSAVQGLY